MAAEHDRPQPARLGAAGAIEPGLWVRHPGQPGWGLGQVQSAIGDRVTVNFEHAGKVVVNARVVALEEVDDEAALNAAPKCRH